MRVEEAIAAFLRLEFKVCGLAITIFLTQLRTFQGADSTILTESGHISRFPLRRYGDILISAKVEAEIVLCIRVIHYRFYFILFTR